MGYGSCHGWDGALGGGWMAGGWLGLLLFAAVVALVVGIVLAMRPRGGSPGDPLEILRARFARGEISAEEFQQARRALGV
ncbi:MAG: SHOCT domain-containing protein [Chloroflexi bacterium]|nr:SHOCT domain-containing protein [Chloroflexota bacterium]